ncbi:TPA_asm: teichoic acid biosynthesis protein [Listeria monocytogenes]|nr:teichoic acid biosynthesis protein [Listeria monocytogenes]EAF4167085.1 teichoic acid biosynthesis protein [Listeria monocytogenes]EAH4082006.1 teichoic acid biosynthesis protein [Listeria monocytogenes]EAK9826931.1 teichoic acid biosynthesis protein [Listeria monocytogenes]ECJ9732520.1 teichoic acid biosynthesis protein [Listeria monocytogenes]
MKPYLNKIELNQENQIWTISGTSSLKIDAIQAHYTEMLEFLRPEKKIDLPFQTDGTNFNASISLQEIAENSITNNKTAWTFRIISEGKSYTIESDGPVSNKEFIPMNTFYQYLFEFPEGIVTLFSKPKEITATLSELQLTSESLSGVINLNTTIEADTYAAEIVFKRRPYSALYLFHEQEETFNLGNIKSNSVNFNVDLKGLSSELLVDSSNVIDAFIRLNALSIKKQHDFYLNIDSSIKNTVAREVELSTPTHSKLTSFVTGSNRLSFYFKKNYQEIVSLASFKEDETQIELQFSLPKKFTNCQLVSKRRDNKAKLFEYYFEQVFPIKKGLLKSETIISRNEFLAGNINKENGIWDFFIRSTDQPDLPIFIPDTIDLSKNKFHKVANQPFLARIIKNGAKNLSITTNPAPESNANPLKIAVMGSCFSRNAFNSKPFFNPDYKRFFEVTFTQSHTSLFSVLSKPYTGINIDDYGNMTDNERRTLQADFDKGFFEKLENSNSDYLLLDLYADVLRGPIWLESGEILSLSYISEQTGILNDLPIKRLLDHSNNDAFFQEWTSYADKFIEKLLTVMPAERIILNKGGFTTKYYDKNGAVQEYKIKMRIERNNYFWDRLNNYFLSKVPTAQVIDFTKKPYIGDYYYPFGHSFSHYESGYYKDFMREMIYITEREKRKLDN